jgi:hypothetical protein
LHSYLEPPGARALPQVFDDDDMTPELCATLCSSNRYFGLEWSRECWCGDELHANTQAGIEESCDMPCAGNAVQKCGAGMRLNLFKNLEWQPEAPSVPTPIENFENYEYQGCWTDLMAPRVLPQVFAEDGMTPQVCAQRCAGKKYIGLEYGMLWSRALQKY